MEINNEKDRGYVIINIEKSRNLSKCFVYHDRQTDGPIKFYAGCTLVRVTLLNCILLEFSPYFFFGGGGEIS